MKTSHIFIIAILFLIPASCSKHSSSTSSKELKIVLNTNTIYNDGLDELIVEVYDANENKVTSDAQILIDGVVISGNTFKASDTKTYTAKAVFKGKESNIVTFNSIRHEVNNFSRKITMEEFAGTWCSLCTRFTYLIDTMVQHNNKIIPVTIHSNDPYQYVLEQQMRARFSNLNFPSAYINRSLFWDQSAIMIQTELDKKSKLGISINTSVGSNNINAEVKVKFDISSSEKLSIVVALLEDSLISTQYNFYNYTSSSPFYGLGDPIQNYVHNNTLRVAATDIFGDTIPVSSQRKNQIWSKAYSINTNSYNIAHCKVVAYVFFTENNQRRWGVLNAQVTEAGKSIDFD